LEEDGCDDGEVSRKEEGKVNVMKGRREGRKLSRFDEGKERRKEGMVDAMTGTGK